MSKPDWDRLQRDIREAPDRASGMEAMARYRAALHQSAKRGRRVARLALQALAAYVLWTVIAAVW